MNNNLFGKYLKKRRKEMKMTLSELADNIGLTHGYISNVENGKMKGNLDLIEGINVKLDIPVLDSIIRLKFDRGDFQKLEEKISSINFMNIDYSDLLVDMLHNKPGKYYLFTRRLLSLKTLDELSTETGLTEQKIRIIEEYGPSNIDDLIKLGKSYGEDDIFEFLTNRFEAAGFDTNVFDAILNGHDVPDLYKIQIMWDPFNKKELSEKEINLKREYEEIYTENFVKQNAKNEVNLKTDDIHFRLSNLDKVYFKGELLNKNKKKKAIKMLEILFDQEESDQ
ncbi:helix-turn-helix domain-containing protein [Virgibacillus halodenitrificans]|uniref:helix-turn-helix domain-containing protein n=1 Tax=Virgibacillus halodenitrificans TaxID=1482 RepID=UPI0007612CA4